MTSNRKKGANSFDHVMPIHMSDLTEAAMQNDSETIWANINNVSKNFTNTTAQSESTDLNNSSTKFSHSVRPKVEILRANSPTLKRLVNVRTKLEKYLGTFQNDFPSRWTSDDQLDESNPKINIESQQTTTTTTNAQSVRNQKPKTPKQTYNGQAPTDKVTYEKTTTQNGNVKQKCSLEIWLPKADTDDDDENQTMSRLYSAKTNGTGNKSSNNVPVAYSQRSSAVKIVTSLIKPNVNEKSVIEKLPKTENTVKPRIYRYGKVPGEPVEERPRSGKSGNTIKSEGELPVKQRNRTIHGFRTSRHLSGIADRTVEEKITPIIPGVPMSSRNLIENIRQKTGNIEPSNLLSEQIHAPMINELMKKYSMMKKSHQELTQTKLKLEKPNHESKGSAHTPRDYAFTTPPAQESTTASSMDHPSMCVKKLTIDASPPRSAADHNHGSARILDRRLSSKKLNPSEVSPQVRYTTLVNNIQTRHNSESLGSTILPNSIGKKIDDSSFGLQRSKTMHLNTETSINTLNNITTITTTLPISSDSRENLSNTVNRTQSLTRGYDQSNSASSKRSVPAPLLALRSEQQRQAAQPILHLVQYHKVNNSARRYHDPLGLSPMTINSTANTGSSYGKGLAQLKYSNGAQSERNCLVPE